MVFIRMTDSHGKRTPDRFAHCSRSRQSVPNCFSNFSGDFDADLTGKTSQVLILIRETSGSVLYELRMILYPVLVFTSYEL